MRVGVRNGVTESALSSGPLTVSTVVGTRRPARGGRHGGRHCKKPDGKAEAGGRLSVGLLTPGQGMPGT